MSKAIQTKHYNVQLYFQTWKWIKKFSFSKFFSLDFSITKQSEKKKNKKQKDNLTFPVSSLMVRGGVFASRVFGSVEESGAQGDGSVNEMSLRLGLERSAFEERKEISGVVGVSFGWGCGSNDVDVSVSFEGKGEFVRQRVTGRQRVGSWCLGLWEKGRKKWEVGNGKIVCVWEGSDQKRSGKWNIFVEMGLGELETPLVAELNFVTKELRFC